MAWDFETEPEFQEKLDWVETFVRDEIEPLDLVLGNPYDKSDTKALDIVRPLQEQVRERGLWPSAHLPTRRAEARARFAELLEDEVANS